jgi:hypothetical protein
MIGGNRLEITLRDEYGNKISRSVFEDTEGVIKDDRSIWILDRDPDICKNTQTVKKLATIFGLLDVIPNIYIAECNTEPILGSATELIPFGISNLESLNSIKSDHGTISLNDIITKLQSEHELSKFINIVDRLSFQKMILFMVIIGYADISPENVMLQHENGKVKFKLVNYHNIFRYGKIVVDKGLLTDPDAAKLRKHMDPKTPELNSIINDVNDRLSAGMMALDADMQTRFKNVVSYFVTKHASNNMIVTEFTKYLFAFDELGFYDYLFMQPDLKTTANGLLKQILEPHLDNNILISPINDKIYIRLHDVIGRHFENLFKEYYDEVDRITDKHIGLGVFKIRQLVQKIKEPTGLDSDFREITRYSSYVIKKISKLPVGSNVEHLIKS